MEDGAGERSAICLHEAIALMSSLEDKELRRYLVSAFFLNESLDADEGLPQIWRWGLEGIVYDIHSGPKITRARDRRRLNALCPD